MRDTQEKHAPTLVNTELRGYRFDALIAQGGFGQVYRAQQPVVDRQVAIKVIQPQYANQPNFVRRFELEAQLIAQLEHPHIVPLYDYWRDASGAYLVMRLLRGGSLTDLLERSRGPLPTDVAARILDQIAAALNTAHRAGVVHRDMKPANVLLDEEQNAYLADFGIARRLFTDEEPEFERFGSPAYVAPETVTSDVASAQTDIYSLGIILFEMLTGRIPFDATSQTLVLEQHLTSQVPSVTGLRPDLPEEVNYVIRRATQRQPKDRYPDTLTMAADFRRLVALGREDGRDAPAAPAPAGRPRSSGTPGRTVILNVAAVAQKNPYKGLRAFQEADSVDFFGRESAIQRLIGRMGTLRCLALVGPSGSGKSSLVRAGLLPALRRGALPGSGKWFFATMTPGMQPFTELEEAIGRVAVQKAPRLGESLRDRPGRIKEVMDQLLPPGGEFLLIIDQLEEVFTLVDDAEERDRFLSTLVAMVEHPRARLVLTLRADFYDRPLLHPEFGALLRDSTEVVLPLTPAEMEAAIVRPAERIGVAFDPGLTARILQDVAAQPGALPLLQYMMYELFEDRRGDRLTVQAYEAEGGVYGALARRAEELYNELDDDAKTAAERIFLRLVNVAEAGDETRRRMLRTEADTLGGAQVERVLEAFGKHRLLTFDRDSATRAPTVEIAHEALIRQWARLRDWIEANRAQIRQRQQLTSAANEWERGGRDAGFLARGGRLSAFELLLDAPNVTLNDEERRYLEASLGERTREARRRQRSLAVLTVITLLAVTAAVVALILRDEAGRERDRADQAARIARADQLAITSLTNQNQLDLSLLLSLHALDSADTLSARRSLLRGLQTSPRLEHFLHGAASPLRAAAVSPDGLRAAAGSSTGAIFLWRLDDPAAAPVVLTAGSAEINALAFDGAGRLFAADGSGQLYFFNAETGEQDGEAVQALDRAVWDIALSPDGATLAAAGANGGLRLWSVDERAPISGPMAGHDGIVFSAAFSPDGATLATGSEDGTVRLWDGTTGAALGEPLEGHPNWVLNLAYSPDGSLLASSDASGFIVFWNAAEDYALAGDPVRIEAENPVDLNVRALAFSADGRTLAAANGDTTIRVWDVETRLPDETPLTGHTDDIWAVAFAGDRRMLSAGRDGRAVLWDLTPDTGVGVVIDGGVPLMGLARAEGGALAAASLDDPGGIIAQFWPQPDAAPLPLRAAANQSTAVAFVPGTTTLLTVDDSANLLLWETPESDRAELLTALPFVPYALAVAPDGSRAAVAGDSSTIAFYTLPGGEPAGTLEVEGRAVRALAFSPDGAVLAAGDENGTVTLFDADGEQTLAFASGDPVVSALDFSDSGALLAAGTSEGRLILLDVAQGTARQPFQAHNDWITAVTFNGDDQLASSSHDRQVVWWNIGEGDGLRLFGHQDWGMGAAFLPGGEMLVTVGRDHRLIEWDLRLESWRTQACAIANRDLTPDEWTRYLGEAPYRPICR